MKRKMTKEINYKDYMQSQEWKNIRTDKLWQANFRCERCGYDGTGESIDVHHKTYERLGNERLSDLEVLCRTCHRLEHGRKF